MKPLTVAVAALALASLPLHAHAACGPAGGSPAQVVQAQVDAYNAHDVDALVACYADDASLEYLSGGHPPIEGRDAIRKAFGFLAGQPQAFGVQIVERIVSGPVVIDLERLHGLPAGNRWPDSTVVYEVRDGRIAKAWFPPAR
ncbi:MAG TPA: nuclear transport factor 2 family protein [Frateuria sp.]|uniref:nuclear transport factor 2 family protein n=1 Tax=Frateuria sp. TaxID=2211372 RepID=UPI002DF2E151|nr:nuclear transport factor 2 family protein [Frateuria sp.]